jgi:mannose-6-phosphate isomerase-like protein (cupin superfamily)
LHVPDSSPLDLAFTYVRVRGDSSVEPLPANDTFWEQLMRGELGSFHNEYLVSCHAFDADWSVWEVHPNGDEIVCLLSGSVTLILERKDGPEAIALAKSGAYVIVPRGTWHTAKVVSPARLLFITAGEGTQHREATG